MKRIVVHPILLAWFSILTLFVDNQGILDGEQIIVPVLIVTIAAVGFWFILQHWLPHHDQPAIVVSVSLLFFFTFGHLMRLLLIVFASLNLVDLANTFAQSKSSQLVAALVWLALWAIAVFLILKVRYSLYPISQFLNVFSITLVALVAFNWFSWRFQEMQSYAYIDLWHRSDGTPSPTNQLRAPSAIRPNIYYIILDEYTRHDILQSLFAYDNTPFLDYLTRKGFYIAKQSTSNYSQTHLSLGSSLNSIYLDDLVEKVGSQSTNRLPLDTMIQDNRLFQRLRGYGYSIVTFSSGFTVTEIKSANLVKSPPLTLTAFERQVVDSTPLSALLQPPFFKDQYDLHRERILYTLDHLADAAQLPAPVFVFAHIVAPHPPFVFGARGEPLQPKRMILSAENIEFADVLTQQEYVDAFTQQLTFLNTRVQTTIDAILANSREPVVIILQADHGPSSAQLGQVNESTMLNERMSILNAFYFSDQNYDQLYPSMTPVNTFRVIQNHYWGADLPLLDEKNYYSTYTRPYALNDVTFLLKSSNLAHPAEKP